MTEQRRQWPLLEDSPALTDPGWLPDPDDAPALADLKETHLRVLAAAAEASATVASLAGRRTEELEAIRAAEEQRLLLGKDGPMPTLSVTDAELTDASTKARAARDALQTFARQAIEQVRERAPEIVAAMNDTRLVAEAKRAEAHALLAEADALEITPKRIGFWLDRVTGRSKLGHFPYDQIAAPAPPVPLDLDAALAGGSFTEVEVLA